MWRNVEHHLPMIAHRVISEIRETYLSDAGQFTREVRGSGYFDAVTDSNLVTDLMYVMKDAVSVEASLLAVQLINAERSLLFATFSCFVRKVYIDGGLRDRVLAEPDKPVQITFSNMTFGCGVDSERVVFWFRDDTGKRGGNVIFSCPLDDVNGLNAYLRSCFATYAIACENIEKVIVRWPTRMKILA